MLMLFSQRETVLPRLWRTGELEGIAGFSAANYCWVSVPLPAYVSAIKKLRKVCCKT